LAKLDKLASFIHRWLAPLRMARKAVDDPVHNAELRSAGGILVPGPRGKDVVMWDEEEGDFIEEWMAWEDVDPANITDILGPVHIDTEPQDPRLRRLLSRISQALGCCVDGLEMLAVTGGIIRPDGDTEAHRLLYHQAVRDRRSPLLSVFITAWEDSHLPDAISSQNSIADLELQIGYWNFRGLGAPMRMMCDFTGVNWENTTYEVKERRPGHWVCHDWDKDDKPVLTKHNPFVQLPYVKNKVTGEVVTQSNAVYLYLGRLLSLNGSTPREQQRNEQVLFYVYQMWMETFDLVYPFKQNKDVEAFQKSLNNHFKTVVPAHYEKLEAWLNLVGSHYFVSRRLPCAADFNVWEVVDQHEQMALKHAFRSPLSSFPLLKAFHSLIQHEPRLQAYFDSENFKLPCNNKMAFFQ